MARSKEPLSREGREARKRKQDELKKIAIRRKSRQLNAIFRGVAILGIVLGLLFFAGDFYISKDLTRSGFAAAKDVMFTGRAWEKTKSVTETFQMREAGIAQHVIAVLPFLLGAFLIMYIVDFKAPLGRSLHIAAVVFAVVIMTFLMIMTGPGSIKEMWPGVKGGPVANEMIALFILFLGALAAAPGSKRRLAECLGEETGVPAGGIPATAVPSAAPAAGASEEAAETAAAAEGVSEAAGGDSVEKITEGGETESGPEKAENARLRTEEPPGEAG